MEKNATFCNYSLRPVTRLTVYWTIVVDSGVRCTAEEAEKRKEKERWCTVVNDGSVDSSAARTARAIKGQRRSSEVNGAQQRSSEVIRRGHQRSLEVNIDHDILDI